MKVYSKLDMIPGGQASGNAVDGCLLLEGGAFRGVFTSGVLDCLMENDINLSVTIGVSAGALNGYNYVAGAIGRSARVNLAYRHDPRWVGISALMRDKGIMGFDFLNKELAELLPFDRAGMMASGRRFIAVATDCNTGKPAYFEKDCGCIERAVKASASMPLVSAMVKIDGIPYLDGGCSRKIPLEWVLDNGFEKVLVVRTKPKGFRREEKDNSAACKLMYRRYPEFLRALKECDRDYNEVCDKIEQMEREGKIVVIYPSGNNEVSRMEGDMEKLGALYFEGYDMARARIDEIKAYFSM